MFILLYYIFAFSDKQMVAGTEALSAVSTLAKLNVFLSFNNTLYAKCSIRRFNMLLTILGSVTNSDFVRRSSLQFVVCLKF